MKNNEAFNDSDKIFITAALWISCITVFAVAMTIGMLPDKISIFYPRVDNPDETYSKYNNLLMLLASVVTAAIVIIVAVLKKRHRMARNFTSIMFFSIILSLCFGGITIYGIMNQFASSGLKQYTNMHGLLTLFIMFLLSLVASLLPKILHTEKFVRRAPERSALHNAIAEVADVFWSVGAFGYLIGGIVCSFTPDVYAYIPVAAAIVLHFVFFVVMTKLRLKKPASK